MADLLTEMAELATRLGPRPGRLGRAVQFVGLRNGDGVSTLARAFACAVAETSRRGVWLVELDLAANAQYDVIDSDPEIYGRLGAAVRGSPDGSTFYRLDPAQPEGAPPAAALLAAYGAQDRNLWVTRFIGEALRPGQTVQVVDAEPYWRQMRSRFDWIVVDAPAVERSDAALVTARRMDANILVLDASRGDIDADATLRDLVRKVGGPVTGAVLNRASRALCEPVRKRR